MERWVLKRRGRTSGGNRNVLYLGCGDGYCVMVTTVVDGYINLSDFIQMYLK